MVLVKEAVASGVSKNIEVRGRRGAVVDPTINTGDEEDRAFGLVFFFVVDTAARR